MLALVECPLLAQSGHNRNDRMRAFIVVLSCLCLLACTKPPEATVTADEAVHIAQRACVDSWGRGRDESFAAKDWEVISQGAVWSVSVPETKRQDRRCFVVRVSKDNVGSPPPQCLTCFAY